MARTAIGVGGIPAGGLDVIVGATFTTMGVGANNGVEFAYRPGALVIVRNTSGATAAFTFKVPTPDGYAAKGLTVPNARTMLYPLSGIFVQGDGLVAVDCDVAGLITVVQP
jgi:hypothetical protein